MWFDGGGLTVPRRLTARPQNGLALADLSWCNLISWRAALHRDPRYIGNLENLETGRNVEIKRRSKTRLGQGVRGKYL